jgi:hypothetical protein
MSFPDSLKRKAELLVKAKRKAGGSMKLKDALDKMARLSGYESWRELMRQSHEDESYARGTGVFPHHWCKTHDEALGVLWENGGVLLPYRKQFFVCRLEHIHGLGIAKDDPDLALVGNDWSAPKDAEALKRLNAKIRKHGR